MKACIYLGATIGSLIGTYVPTLWGDNILSLMSLLLGATGGILGIWAGYIVGKRYF